MSTASLPRVGDVIGDKYRIEGQLGEGGMAYVFAAHHELLDIPVAVKLLSPTLPRTQKITDRFLREARAAARVDSAHVARVMDVGTYDGTPYMVMERLEGCDLAELLELEGRINIKDAIDYVLQALQGLAHAHTLGVVHRDLKPANLFLAHQSDGSAIVKILDFGIAKLEATDRMTDAGQAVGSPMYMSPEHIKGGLVDHRSDIWAMGVVLYELVSGTTPFEADGVGETFAAVLQRKPKPLKEVRPDVPDALDAAVMKCLERDPDQRHADVSQLARAIAPFGTGVCTPLVQNIEQTLRQRLRRYSGQPILVRPQTPSQPLNPNVTTLEAPAVTDTDLTPKKTRRGFWVAFAVVALLGIGSALFLARGRILPQTTAAAVAPTEDRADRVVATTSASASAKPVVSTSTKPAIAKPPATTKPKAAPSPTTTKLHSRQ